MPASGEAQALVDTSVAVAFLVADHEQHAEVVDALSGHAAFETFSVLTRLPPPLRRTPRAVARLLSAGFAAPRFLGEDATSRLLTMLPSLGISGGAVYDALVAAVAVHHEMPLITRDRRAVTTYRALDVDLVLLD